MKHSLISFMLIIIFSKVAFCQINSKTRNSEELLNQLKIKNLKTYYYQSEDTSNSNGWLFIEKRFNAYGQPDYFYELVIRHDGKFTETTTYKYDKNGQLVENLKIWKPVKLEESDQHYINEHGDNPVNIKIIFKYNDKGQLIEKKKYMYGSEGFDENNDCQKVNYMYSEDKLIEEFSSSMDCSDEVKNIHKKYKYNADDQKIEVVVSYGPQGQTFTQSYFYKYNDSGQLIEMINFHDSLTPVNKRILYDYDIQNRLVKETEFSFDPNQKNWIKKDEAYQKEYQYNEQGNRILRNKNVEYTFYPNGLIKQQIWKFDDNNKISNYISQYDYY